MLAFTELKHPLFLRIHHTDSVKNTIMIVTQLFFRFRGIQFTVSELASRETIKKILHETKHTK